MSEKIGPQHLSRKAMLYVRQSSAWQVANNLESQRLQYAMEAHLRQFGIVTSRSALESCLKTHRKQFRIRTQGREKFVAWKEGAANETASTSTGARVGKRK